MNRITLKEYALKHKLSIFNVMKMIRADKLKYEEVDEDGKNVLYIILDDKIENEVTRTIIPIKEKEDLSLREEVQALNDEIKLLRKEVDLLKKSFDGDI